MKKSNSNTRIRELIAELNITQTEFCQKTGITKSALSQYLNGNREPRQDQIAKIADAYNINPAWLMGYDIDAFTSNIILSNHERSVIIAYRSHIDMQDAVDRLLGIEKEKKTEVQGS